MLFCLIVAKMLIIYFFERGNIMEKYTASYGNIKNSFTFQNIEGKIIKNHYSSVFSVLRNIIQRGNPSNPSLFLKSKL